MGHSALLQSHSSQVVYFHGYLTCDASLWQLGSKLISKTLWRRLKMGSSIESIERKAEEKAKVHQTSGCYWHSVILGIRALVVLLNFQMYFFSDALFYGSIASFVSGVLLLMSFASPYWLQSWEDTQSPFKNMGLWEFCFYKFRHPDYQFDHLFHGCHALYGDEYRLIREKLLPGWLMVVQLFVTLALIASFLGQVVIVCLLLRAPLEWILRFEWYFCGVALVCKGVTGD